MRRFVLVLILLIPLSGCSVYKAVVDPDPLVEVPENYLVAQDGQATIDRWWLMFEDPALNVLIEEALASNHDLQIAWARLEQVEALRGQAGAAYWPTLSLEAASGRQRSNVNITDSYGNVIDTKAVHGNQHKLNLAAAYELDLWGKIASMNRAADLSYRASRLELESAAMTLAAQMADLWYTLIEQQAQLDLLREQIAANRTYLQLVELRFGLGLASSVDVLQQRQQLVAQYASLPLLEVGVENLKSQINILLGRSSQADLGAIPAGLPDLWLRPSAGLPADLLTRRPDVKAAQLRVMAADNTVGQAVADRLPSFTIMASTGYAAADYSDLLENWIWSIADSLAVTIFDGHRKNLEVEKQKAVVKEQLHSYTKVVLTAVSEVEDAYRSEESQMTYLERVRKRETLAQATFDASWQRYINGLSDYLPVLTSLQALQQTERDLIAAERTLISNRIKICRTLGGEWTAELENAGEEE